MRTQWKAQLAIAALGALLALSLGACDGGPTGPDQRASPVTVQPRTVGVERDEAKRSAAGLPLRITGQGTLPFGQRLELR